MHKQQVGRHLSGSSSNLMANLSNFSCSVSVSCTFPLGRLLPISPDYQILTTCRFYLFTLLLDSLATLFFFFWAAKLFLYGFFLTRRSVFWDTYWSVLFRGTKFGVWERSCWLSWGSYGSYIIGARCFVNLGPSIFCFLSWRKILFGFPIFTVPSDRSFEGKLFRISKLISTSDCI